MGWMATLVMLSAAVQPPTQLPEPWREAPEQALPLDAFGRTGRYDRSRILRLYGGRRPLVARGTRLTGDGRIEAWTLVSPYPDPGLRRIERGTLLLVFRRAA